MVTTYCDRSDIGVYCHIVTNEGTRPVWGTNPVLPTNDEVDELINTAEGLVEDYCKNAWGTRTITETEETCDIDRNYSETSIKLRHTNVKAFDTGQGDKIECWDGTQWVDYVASYTEGRGDDFYVDYALGKIYFLNNRPHPGKLRAKVTYRRNSGSTVPQAVKAATALWVGILLASSPQAANLFPEGEGEDYNLSDRIRIWDDQIKRLLEPHKGQSFVKAVWTPIL